MKDTVRMGKSRYTNGLTTVRVGVDRETNETVLRVKHTGNMGMANSIEDIKANVRQIFDYDDELEFDVRRENGSPDYMYKADFYFA